MILPGDYVIDDSNFQVAARPVDSDGIEYGKGLVERDYSTHPVGYCDGSTTFGALNDELPLIPWEAMPDLIADKVRNKTQLSDIRNIGNNGDPIPSLDQNGQGYCWAYSTTSAIMLLRAAAGMPHVRLSGHSIGCVVKGFRDQGGWGALSLDFAMKNGVQPTSLWPEKSMKRDFNTEANWKEAQKYRVVEGFIDLDEPVYSRDLSLQQRFTCLLCNIPVIGDRSWWSHSTCDVDLIDDNPSLKPDNPLRYAVRTWNSWRDSWGNNGMGVIRGNKVAASGVAPRAVVLT